MTTLFQTGSDHGWQLAATFAKASRCEKRVIIARLRRMSDADHNDFVRGLFFGVWQRADLLYHAGIAGKGGRLNAVVEAML